MDPGLASTGLGAVERFPDGTYRTLGVRVSRTEPTREKSFTLLRTSNDDQRRIREHHAQIVAAMEAVKPNCIGIENYTVFEPNDVAKIRGAAEDILALFGGGTATLALADFLELLKGEFAIRLLEKVARLAEVLRGNVRSHAGLGQAAKTIAVYGAALAVAFAAGVPVFVFQPSDLKRRFTGKKSASKEEVGRGVSAVVFGLEEAMTIKVPQHSLREHGFDAVGHSILAAEEYHKFRLDVGR